MKLINNIMLQEDECIKSYYVKIFFIFVPFDPTIKIILKQGIELQQITPMSVGNVINLLEFCLKNI